MNANMRTLVGQINLDYLKNALRKKDYKGYHYRLEGSVENIEFLLVLDFKKENRKHLCELFAYCKGHRICISKFKTSKKELSLMNNELLGQKLKENKNVESL